MKHFIQLTSKVFLILLLFVQVSCSWVGVRGPAAKKIDPNVTADQVFSIESSNVIGKKNFKENFVNSLGFHSPPNLSFVTELSKDLPDNVAFKLELAIEDDKYIYKILHSTNAFKDPGASEELGRFIEKLMMNPNLGNHLSNFEMYYNAVEGDPIALDNFLKIKALDSVYTPIFLDDEYVSEFPERQKVTQSLRKELAPQIKELKTARQAIKESRKSIIDKLDKAPEGKQLKALVAKGDRNGAADLIKKYLPFEEMAPFEKRFWETYLEIMRNPVPLDQRILSYRGLHGDTIFPMIENGNELTKVNAIKESKAFVMSTVLVKNQGSWNRRLRSLDAMNDKFIATINNSDEYSQSARISTMFLKHSGDPKGSPFISLTPDINIAKQFTTDQMMTALIDPRMMSFNYVSNFTNEVEFLTPLVTFPDEMAGLWNRNYTELEKEEHLEKQLRVKIEEEFGKGKADEVLAKIKKNSSDYFSRVFNDGSPKNKKIVGGPVADFYKKFAKKDTIKPAFDPKGNLTCKDLLALFWVIQ